MCLDVENDGTDTLPWMVPCGDDSGHLWKLEPSPEPGYSYVKTSSLGEGQCLDIVNDGVDTKLHMDACGGYSGQMWRLDPF
jgi:hypothetical protein